LRKIKEFFTKEVQASDRQKATALRTRSFFHYKIAVSKRQKSAILLLIGAIFIAMGLCVYSITREIFYSGRDFVYQSCEGRDCSAYLSLNKNNVLVSGESSFSAGVEATGLESGGIYLYYYEGASGVSRRISIKDADGLSLVKNSTEGHLLKSKYPRDFFNKPAGVEHIIYEGPKELKLKRLDRPSSGDPAQYFGLVGWLAD